MTTTHVDDDMRPIVPEEINPETVIPMLGPGGRQHDVTRQKSGEGRWRFTYALPEGGTYTVDTGVDPRDGEENGATTRMRLWFSLNGPEEGAAQP